MLRIVFSVRTMKTGAIFKSKTAATYGKISPKFTFVSNSLQVATELADWHRNESV